MTTKVIANQKGGIAKTTTATNLSGAYSSFGKKILLVDLDPQGNASKSSTESQFSDSVLNVYLNKKISPLKTNDPNIDLLPSSRTLSSIIPKMTLENEILFKLKDYLKNFESAYDIVIIDTPPTILNLTLSGMVAADYLLIPMSTNFFTLQGTEDLLESFRKVKENLNPDLKLLGACISIHDKRTALANQILGEIKSYFNGRLLESIIPREIKIEEAQVNCSTVVKMFPESKSAKAYLNLAREIESKIGEGE